METPELLSAPARPADPGSAALADLQQQVGSLRLLVNLVLLILLLGGFAGISLLLKKVGQVRRQVEVNQPQVDKLAADYDTVFKPRLNAFLQALLRYGQTDANFVNVLRKYPIQQQPPAAAAAPVSSPVPAPPAK